MRSAAQPGTVVKTAPAQAGSASLALGGLLFLAFLVRLLFINADGFKSDVSTFEAWALALAEHPLREFFSTTRFADYPPGYFYVLWFVGHAYKLLIHADPDYAILRAFVKMPAILADLVCSYLIYRDRATLTRRRAGLSPRPRSLRSIRRASSSLRIGAKSIPSR